MILPEKRRFDFVLFGYRRTFVATDVEGLIQRV